MVYPFKNEKYFSFQRRFIIESGYVKGQGVKGEYIDLMLKASHAWHTYNNQVAGGGSKEKVIEPHFNWVEHCGYNKSLLRDSLTNHPKVNLDDIDLGDRLGSISQDAFVRLGTIRSSGIQVAVKFLPPVNKNSSGEEEVAIATKFGDLARFDPGLPFLITLGYGYAKIKLPDDFVKKEDAIRADIYKQVLLKTGTKRDAIIAMRGDISKHDGTVTSIYIISELARGDLKQIPLSGKLIDKARCALSMLHNFNHAHGDPHLGNFLVLQDGQVVIHDFGHSFEGLSKTDVQYDVEFLDRAIESQP